MTRFLMLASLLALAACSSTTTIPTVPALDQTAIDARATQIEPRVVSACNIARATGTAVDLAAIAVPGVSLLGRITDRACDDTLKTAKIIAAAEEAARMAQTLQR